MYGNIEKQMSRLIKESGVYTPGHSKHEERKIIKLNTKTNSHEISKKSNIYSNKYFKNSESTWRDFAKSLIKNKIKDLEQASGRSIDRYLNNKINEKVTLKHFHNICSHLTKLESMLNRYSQKFNTGKVYDFDKKINRAKSIARKKLKNEYSTRAYEKPKELINAIPRKDYKLSASIQLEGGARLREAGLIDQSRLGGIQKNKGLIILKKGDGKGGKERVLEITKETYAEIQQYVNFNKQLKIDNPVSYRKAIKDAAFLTNQKYTGSHGLRHNYAQFKMNKYVKKGYGHFKSCLLISRKMGHERPSITETYLR